MRAGGQRHLGWLPRKQHLHGYRPKLVETAFHDPSDRPFSSISERLVQIFSSFSFFLSLSMHELVPTAPNTEKVWSIDQDESFRFSGFLILKSSHGDEGKNPFGNWIPHFYFFLSFSPLTHRSQKNRPTSVYCSCCFRRRNQCFSV